MFYVDIVVHVMTGVRNIFVFYRAGVFPCEITRFFLRRLMCDLCRMLAQVSLFCDVSFRFAETALRCRSVSHCSVLKSF